MLINNVLCQKQSIYLILPNETLRRWLPMRMLGKVCFLPLDQVCANLFVFAFKFWKLFFFLNATNYGKVLAFFVLLYSITHLIMGQIRHYLQKNFKFLLSLLLLLLLLLFTYILACIWNSTYLPWLPISSWALCHLFQPLHESWVQGGSTSQTLNLFCTCTCLD